MSASSLNVVQFRLNEEYPGAKVRGAFIGDTRRPGQSGLGFDGTGSALDLFILPILAVVAGLAAVFRLLKRRPGTRFLVVITDDGTALARCHGSVGQHIKSWVHGPIAGLRYELDPLNAAGLSDVQIVLGDRTLWASGTDRDAAFRLFDKQAP